MRRSFVLLVVLLCSCAPVLNREYMQEGNRDVSFAALRHYPGDYKGKLYVLGAVIVQNKLTAQGSQIEAMHVPVDRYGYFQNRGQSQGRFLALLPGEQRMLDPEIFRKGRRLTMAVEFSGARQGQIDEIEYTYPVFLIREIYLWPRETRQYPAYYYDPWFYPHPYYFWDPWWRYPYYYNYYYRPALPPVYRRDRRPEPAPAPAQPPASPRRRPIR